MSHSEEIWILAEQRLGELHEVSLELMGKGREIADKLAAKLCVVIMGKDIAGLANLLTCYGADKVYIVDSALLANYSGELYVDAVTNVLKDERPSAILCGATSFGLDLAPRLAARFETGLASDCVAINLREGDLLLQTKPMYGGRLEGTLVCPTVRPQVATVRQGLMRMVGPDESRKAEVVIVSPNLHPDRPYSKVIDFIKGDPRTMSLTESEIIVAGGRGMGSADNFRLLDTLADLLGGNVAASRMAIDAGWVSTDKMVGISGKFVAPKLYIACGISGAPQHLAAIRGSKNIIAVNKDPNAPILKIADIGIVGDVVEVLPMITQELRELQTEE